MPKDAVERTAEKEARTGRIRQMRAAGAPLAEIAHREGVSVSTVQLALYGWSVDEPPPVFYEARGTTLTLESDSPEELRIVFGLVRRALEKSRRSVTKARG